MVLYKLQTFKKSQDKILRVGVTQVKFDQVILKKISNLNHRCPPLLPRNNPSCTTQLSPAEFPLLKAVS